MNELWANIWIAMLHCACISMKKSLSAWIQNTASFVAMAFTKSWTFCNLVKGIAEDKQIRICSHTHQNNGWFQFCWWLFQNVFRKKCVPITRFDLSNSLENNIYQLGHSVSNLKLCSLLRLLGTEHMTLTFGQNWMTITRFAWKYNQIY